MAEQTSLVAQQVRLMHWAEQIRECQNRPEGMGVSTNPLKRVRQMYLDQLPEAEKPAFVELPRLKAERTATVPEVPVMCIKNGNGLSAERECNRNCVSFSNLLSRFYQMPELSVKAGTLTLTGIPAFKAR